MAQENEPDEAATAASALKLEPKNLSAQLLQARYASPTERTQLAKKLVTDHPEDGNAWLMLSGSLPDKEAREEATRKAYELLPDNALALNNYAWLLLQQGKSHQQ